MVYSTSSTITSATSFDQGTYDTYLDDDSTLRGHRVNNGFCGFFSVCFEDEHDHTDYRMLEDSTASLSLEGSARIKMEAQEVEKRKKKSWLGMSFSFDDLTGKKQHTKKGLTTTIPINGEEKKKPSTIIVSKVEAADKYVCAGQAKCKVDDDVDSEVSLDFTDPGQHVKGQRIHISKNKEKKSTATNNVKDTKTNKKSKDKDTKNTMKESTKEHPSSKKQTSNPSLKERKEHVESPKAKSSMPKTKITTEAEKNPSMKGTKIAERGNRAKMAEKEFIDNRKFISKPRVIPDFSKKELQMRARRTPPEPLQWKYGGESRWEIHGDPRKNRVEHLWKDEQRRGQQYPEDMMRERWNRHHPEGRDPIDYYDGQDYDYEYDSEEEESDEDSYVDRYASGPCLPSPEIAAKRARQMAIECRNVHPVVRRRPPLQNPVEYTYYDDEDDDDDDLDDYAEVNDLDRPRYVRSSLYQVEEMAPVSPGKFHL